MTATVVTPRRIRLSRARGFRLADASTNPNGVVNVARPSKWGNPYAIHGTADMWVVFDHRTGKIQSFHNSKAEAQAAAVREFVVTLVAGMLPYSINDVERELAGKDVACWCAEGEPCHGLPLLEIANADQAVGR